VHCSHLLKALEKNGTSLHITIFFTSPDLFWQLLQDGIYAIGTCRTNRKGWPDALTISPSAGERGQLWYRVHASERMVAVTWYDNKPVSFLSTTCSPIDPTKSLYINRWHVDG
jgi:phage terminase large subunit-like protein